MDENKKNDRLSIMRNIVLIAFVVILLKIVYMTTLKYEHYTELAENKTYKELPIKAPRGEVKDRYGRLLAGNKTLFTVQVSGDGISKKDSEGVSVANDISLNLINLLEKNKEEYIDEFPIYIENGKYYYTFDKNIREYKTPSQNNISLELNAKENDIPLELNAKESFYYIVDRLISEGILSEEDRKLEPSKLQKKLNENSEYPPILVSKWMFTDEKNKEDWLQSYKITEPKVSAKEAFRQLREYYEIDPSLSDKEARKILVVRDLIKSQGYSRYKPMTIAKDISQETMAQLEENAMKFPGVSVATEPVRYYPEGALASHTLGQMGKIPSSEESKYFEKNEGKKYSKGDTIGVSGIEKNYEEQLKGVDGYEKVQVDALGRITKKLDVKEPKSGDTVYLSIDKDLQMKTEKLLKDILETMSRGGTYKSKYGDKSFSNDAPNAKSGAVIAIDPKTGDVLSMASYPDYDPNLFVNGISYDEYENLKPKNTNDVLAPNAQINLATQSVVQPGSIFKMITGMAAIDNGLSPNYAINDSGVIYLGQKPFADLIWHKSRSTHGYTDLYRAIQESCNIYFATIASGKNWSGGKDPDVKIGPNDVLDYARKFGLDDYTGLDKEIGEKKGTVPSVESKLETTKSLLRNHLNKEMTNDFTDITKDKNPDEYKKRIEEIVSWTDEEKTPGRVEAINRLSKMKIKEDRVEPLADDIVFTYLNFSKWKAADTFNLAIGQGENAYTPAQMARYVSTIANGGDLVDVSAVDRVISSDYKSVDIDENENKKADFNDSEKLNDLKKGMVQMANESASKTLFSKIPVTVAAKTGTAEKSGKIPTANEVEYLESHMGSYKVSLEEASKLANQLKTEREKELSTEREKELKEELKNNKDLTEKERAALEEELEDGVKVKLSNDDDKVNASFLRKAIKELNPKISDEQIDAYKPGYSPFAWSVAFAPAEDPQIAVVTMIPQGSTGGNSLYITKEVIGTYFDLGNERAEDENNNSKETDKNINIVEDGSINFAATMKK
ncbi:penicillin-binding transpeptidase domain-containing protein [Romboutsia sp.]|uniref:penicillin-binding transpeptidase domain-containing protein n=1 Tax=Romboutsia sp. TaxID=1965302 RepID=UPI003F2D0DAF